MKPPVRVLLVEDDPTSRAVLSAALRNLPADVDAAPDVRSALACASSHRHALWLVDAHLPDGSGVELLRALRSMDPHAVAVAHTASCDPRLARELRAEGFVDVLVKPLPAAEIRDSVRRAMAGARPVPTRGSASSVICREVDDGHGLPLLDDDVAAAALGDRAHVATLRGLFAEELAGYVARAATHAPLNDDLHRLRASCGFVGAVRLGWAAAALQRDTALATRATFMKILGDTRAALVG